MPLSFDVCWKQKNQRLKVSYQKSLLIKDGTGAAIAFKNIVSEYLGIELETLQRNALARFDNVIGKDEKDSQGSSWKAHPGSSKG